MRRFPNQPSKKTRIEIIPMIDVMMFLLVFFVLLSINVIPALGLKTKLPSSSTAEEQQNPPEKIIITLTQDNIIQINGNTVSSLEQLRSSVQTIQADSKDKKLIVFINGDKGVELQQLIDVMDLLKSCGINAITIATKQK